MKKRWQRALALCLVLLTVSVSSVAAVASGTQTETQGILDKYSITVITESPSMMNADSDVALASSFDAATAGNYLFVGTTFDSAIVKADDIRGMIQNGNLIAVYNENGIDENYEEQMGLPLGFVYDQIESEESSLVAVGKIYYTDANGYPSIARYNVDPDEITEDTYDNFVKYLNTFVVKESASQTAATMAASTTATMDFVGTATDAFEGSDNKGNIEVVYEVATAQSIDGYDYYAVHAIVEATPGDALYNNGYDLEKIAVRLYTYTANAILYKVGPNTTSGATTYSVDIGFTGTKDGAEVGFTAGWSRTIEDVNISKVKDSQTSCSWTVDVNDWKKVADSTLTFEPGGTYRVPDTNDRLLVCAKYGLTVDCAWDAPTAALSDEYSSFYCDADSVW